MSLTRTPERLEDRGSSRTARFLQKYRPGRLVVPAIRILVVGTLLTGMFLVAFSLFMEGIDARNYWLEKSYTVEEMEYMYGGR